MSMRRVFIGGNWKSNGDKKFVTSHMTNVINQLSFNQARCDVVICPTNLQMGLAQSLLDSKSHVQLSAQNVSMNGEGAFTGEVSAKQLKDFGINWTLVGHSERRQFFGDTNEIVGKKTKIAGENGVSVVGCIGELLSDREAKKTMEVCIGQLKHIADNTTDWNNLVIAYEPVWAIGTGVTASNEQAQEVHGELRNWLAKNVSSDVAKNVRIIYGGSVTDGNAKDLILQSDIDGFLVRLFFFNYIRLEELV